MRHKHSVTEDPTKLIGLATIAAAVGAIVAMLFTPRDGGQVRRGIKRRAVNAKDVAHDRLQRGSDEAAEVADDTKQRLQSTAAKVVADTKSTVQKTKTDAKVVKRRTKAAASGTKTPAARSPRTPRTPQ